MFPSQRNQKQNPECVILTGLALGAMTGPSFAPLPACSDAVIAAKAAAEAEVAAKAAAAAAAAAAEELLANPPPPPPNPFNLLDPMHDNITARPLPPDLLELASSTIPAWLPSGASIGRCIHDSSSAAACAPTSSQQHVPSTPLSSSSSCFHSSCDNAGSTLILVQDNLGNAFGAYASCCWTSPAKSAYQAAPGTFLFSLKRACDADGTASAQLPAKFNLLNPDCEDAMFCAASCGPVLGFGLPAPPHPPHTPRPPHPLPHSPVGPDLKLEDPSAGARGCARPCSFKYPQREQHPFIGGEAQAQGCDRKNRLKRATLCRVT